MTNRIAPECGCETPGKIVRGMCAMHYDRWVHKTPKDQRGLGGQALRRFEQFVDRSGGDDACWVWTGPVNARGYGLWSGGRVPGDGRRGLAHRLALAESQEIALPTPKVLACHHCDNPPCVNPTHLYWGTAADNARDAAERGLIANAGVYKLECPRGHLKEGENRIEVATPTGISLRCRTCERDRKRESERRRRRIAGIAVARYWKDLDEADVVEALRRVADGDSLRQVASFLGMSLATIQKHLPLEAGYREARTDARRAA